MSVGGRSPLRSDRRPIEVKEDDTYLPPRNAVHPSERGKWTRIFYLTLLWLFIILVGSLTVWGIKYYS
ncbi:hypothetical protein [Paenibacillus sp. Soil724D2]|uniref:hypothetical protein n=1 Tax=Paenibacillus sp. (strain Soil724D2) TaxID=1736392 RepID=UPI00070992E6|nr:hypothetical protein [Paenibacillus sp. Soil724D2]KQX68791.1 hypothetical protein ASD40_23250 [Paenibacillus sp. Root444D2]KRE32452.1 hypothetical protein ASG85_17400 [Paenibacillus sp. Soil724D2]